MTDPTSNKPLNLEQIFMGLTPIKESDIMKRLGCHLNEADDSWRIDNIGWNRGCLADNIPGVTL